MKKTLFIAVILSLVCLKAPALTNVRFHDEANDTTRINEILSDAASHKFKTPSERCGYIARKFIGKPYVSSTLEGTPEMVTVNIDEFDCTTFVETVLAMAYTIGEGRTSWRDFVYNLERLRYRGGEAGGYSSRMHYVCDWMVDNIHRGNVKDATSIFPRINYIIRTIDFMSSNRDKYPALADSTQFANIKNVEIGYRGHRFPYVKTVDLGMKETKSSFIDGDAVALVSTLKNLDVSHMGFVIIENGEPYLLHASSNSGKVEVSQRSLHDHMKRSRNQLGVRVIRLCE